jgi:hypothetical protein
LQKSRTTTLPKFRHSIVALRVWRFVKSNFTMSGYYPGNIPHDNSQITCAKCGRPNPAEAASCAHCRAHLYIECLRCGKSNVRLATRYVRCNSALRGSRWRRLGRRIRGRNPRVRLAQILLAVAFVVLAYILLAQFSDISSPSPSPPDTDGS